jgi:hypothetical protein
MNNVFCSVCCYTGAPGFTPGVFSTVIGVFLGLFAFIAFLASSFTVMLFFGVLGAIFFGLAYAMRSFHCAMCGSKELIPVDSPKAIEFQNRADAFQHIQNKLPSEPVSEPTAEPIENPEPENQPVSERTIRPLRGAQL